MSNPAAFLKHEDQLRTVSTLKDHFGTGHFYTLDYQSDYRLDDMLKANVTNNDEFQAALQRILIADRLPKPSMGAGCTAFMVKDRRGHVLVGRNYDFRHEPATLLIKTSPEGENRSMGMCDLAFIDIKPGQLSDGRSDISSVMMFPYLTLDGLNDKGVCISVLQLRNATTNQDTGKGKVVTTLAIRAVLDRAGSVQEAMEIFSSYDMQSALPGNDYHFLLADKKGDSAVIEYVDNKMNVISTDRVTNFFLSKGSRRRGAGKERYDVVDAVMRYHEGIMERKEVMETLKLVSQPSPLKKTGGSRTLWSAVYDLTAGELDLAIDRKYGRILHFSL